MVTGSSVCGCVWCLWAQAPASTEWRAVKKQVPRSSGWGPLHQARGEASVEEVQAHPPGAPQRPPQELRKGGSRRGDRGDVAPMGARGRSRGGGRGPVKPPCKVAPTCREGGRHCPPPSSSLWSLRRWDAQARPRLLPSAPSAPQAQTLRAASCVSRSGLCALRRFLGIWKPEGPL